jgi:hypothetical protein
MRNIFPKNPCVSFFVAIFLFYSGTATAASITNLDDIPYDLQIRSNNKVQNISIDAGKTWSTETYPVQVKNGKRWMTLEGDSGYAIWKGGTLTKQRRGIKMRGSGG